MLDPEMFKEVITALISVMIIAGTVVDVIWLNHQNGIMVGLSGAVVAFYLTRGAVQTGQNGATKTASTLTDVITNLQQAGTTNAINTKPQNGTPGSPKPPVNS